MIINTFSKLLLETAVRVVSLGDSCKREVESDTSRLGRILREAMPKATGETCRTWMQSISSVKTLNRAHFDHLPWTI